MKLIYLTIDDCSDCPWGIPSVPPNFEPDYHADDGSLCMEYMASQTGLFCRSADQWIGGKDKKYEGPIPKWCPLPEGSVQ